MNIYQHTNYRTALQELVRLKRAIEPTVSYASLATQARVQRSFVSQVLAGKYDFTADQMFLIGSALGLTPDETEYLCLLVDLERSQVPTRKEALKRKSEQLRRKGLGSNSSLKSSPAEVDLLIQTAYYSDPHLPIIHMFLMLEEYARNPMNLAERLAISPEKVKDVLLRLERAGIISAGRSGYQVLKKAVHLDAESPLSRTNATLFRLRAIEAHQKSMHPEDYFFTATFSGTEEVRQEIRMNFLKLLKRMKRSIDAAPSREVFHVNFDLFRI